MRRLLFPLLAVLVAVVLLWQPDGGLAPETGNLPAAETTPQVAGSALPQGVQAVVGLIERGGPFPHRQDGTVFKNREGRLPAAAPGYYHEYTVPTPGARDRGARRLVTGGNPPVVWYYTGDHYRSFQAFDPENLTR